MTEVVFEARCGFLPQRSLSLPDLRNRRVAIESSKRSIAVPANEADGRRFGRGRNV
jgi:hypothetical protein